MIAPAGKSAGFTLIELIVAITLVALLVAVALPSYQSLRQEQMVRAATAAIYTDMMLLKSEAIKRNTSLTLKIFNAGTANWCYRIVTSGSCTSCTDNGCNGLEGRKGADASEFPGISLNTNSYSGGAVTFSPRRGTLPAGNVEVSSGSYFMSVVTNNIGRVRTCVGQGGTC